MKPDGEIAMTEHPAAAPAPGTAPKGTSIPRRKFLYALVGVAGLVLLLLYVEGAFDRGKVAPGLAPRPPEAPSPGIRAIPAVRKDVEDVLEWPGTVRSRSEARLSSKLLARILDIRVDVGSPVKAGDVLAVLDERDVASRLRQAKAALEAAEAQAAQAVAEFARVKGLFDKEAATRRDLEAAEARATSSRALVEQARHGVAEAEVFLTETQLRAPFDGVITEKSAQPGDTAAPATPILVVQDPRRLRLEAAVPESCVRKAAIGMEVRIRIDTLGREMAGRVEEISPVADPESKTFLLKASLPADESLRPGMFGRFLQSCGVKPALLIPTAAVARLGQVESVRVIEGGEARIRHVRTGKLYADQVEILSGLREGERVLVQEGPP